jgi:prevent-host-death family protein
VADVRRAVASSRNVPDAQVEVGEYSATEARSGFAQVLETVSRRGLVVIHKQKAPKAVVLSFEDFQALVRRPKPLDVLTETFDDLLAQMQKPAARAGMRRAFDASPEELGKLAVAAARKRVG